MVSRANAYDLARDRWLGFKMTRYPKLPIYRPNYSMSNLWNSQLLQHLLVNVAVTACHFGDTLQRASMPLFLRLSIPCLSEVRELS